MTLIIPDGFAEAVYVLKHEMDPEAWNVTFGVDMSSVTAGDAEDVSDHLKDQYLSTVQAFMDENVQLQSIKLRIGMGTGADPLVFEKGYALGGTDSAERLPQNCAVHVAKQTALGGRKHKGRFFWPGILARNSCNEMGQIESGALASFQEQFDDLLTGISVGSPGTPMVILHNDVGGTTPAPTEVTSLRVDSLVSTQRRRLR